VICPCGALDPVVASVGPKKRKSHYRIHKLMWPLCGAKKDHSQTTVPGHHILRSTKVEKTPAATTGCGTQGALTWGA